MQHYHAALAYNERLVNAAFEFWMMATLPSLYFARAL